MTNFEMSNFQRRDAADDARRKESAAYYAEVDTYPRIAREEMAGYPCNPDASAPYPDIAVALHPHPGGLVIVDNYTGDAWSHTVWPDESAAMEKIARWNSTLQIHRLVVVPAAVP